MAAPGSLTLVSGGFQDAVLNTYFLQTIRVLAKDTTGAIMVNEPIVFGLPVSGAGGVFAWTGTRTCQSFTDANGIAESQQIYANATVGQWTGLAQFVNALGINVGYIEYNLPTVPIAYTMALDSGGNQKVAQSSPFAPLVVLVKDQYGNPWVSGTVVFTFPGANGSPGGTTNIQTDANGYATSPVFTSNTTAGSFTVSASSQGYPKADPSVSATWTTINATIPTSFSIVGGNNQQAVPSGDFGAPLSTRIYNGLGQPLAGITVTFTAPTTGARCTFAGSNVGTAVTDASGTAASSIPKANATLGKYNVVASAGTLPSLTFRLTNGINYLPEVCTTSAPPQGAVNQGTGTAWTNPGGAIDGGTTGASATIVTTTGSAGQLFCSPAPVGAFDPIADDAKITKFIFTYDVRTNIVAGASFYPVVSCRLFDGTTGRSSVINDAGGTGGNTWNSKTQTISTFSGPTTISGAQLKAGNFGMGFYVNSSNATGGSAGIRRVKISVCYQNPDVPPATVDVPLHFCEA